MNARMQNQTKARHAGSAPLQTWVAPRTGEQDASSLTRAGSAAPALMSHLEHSFGNVPVHAASVQAKTEASYDEDVPEDDQVKIEQAPKPAATHAATPAPPTEGSGRPLPAPVQAQMSTAFHTRFSDVRIHEGPEAAAIGAIAYTHGNDIHFAPGRYDPSSPAGRYLLGHELTHVVQQRAGRVSLPQANGAAVVHDCRLESEADDLGAKAARGEPAWVQNAASTGPGAPGAIQCASISWNAANYSAVATGGSSTTVEDPFAISYKASQDAAKSVWNLDVNSISGGATIEVHTGGSTDPIANPPTTEADAKTAVTVMKGYYARGSRGAWHTEAASKSHELHHYKEWKCSAEHYWPDTETALKKLNTPTASAASEADAITAMRAGAAGADAKMKAFRDKAHDYWFTLEDNASSRPYAAGQLTLNTAVQSVQTLAGTKGWTVEAGIDTPSDANPCYKPWLPYAP